MQEAEGVNGEVTAGACHFAQVGRQVQRDGAGVGRRAGLNRQVLRGVVDQRVVGRFAGDRDVDGVGCRCQAFHTHKVRTGGAGFNGCPLAGCGRGGLLGGNGQRKVHARQLQARGGAAAAVDAGECSQARAANGQLVYVDRVG